MSQNDYIILRDEDGKAYIAHASLLDNARNAIRGAANSISTTAQQVANKAKGVGRGVRQNHKYILKVNENGRTRYFYKQEEVKAYYEAKKRGIKNPAEYAQNAGKKAVNTVKNAVREVTGQAARDRMDAAAEKFPEADKAYTESFISKENKKIKYDAAERHLNDAAYDATQAQNKLNQANWLNQYSRTKANQKAQADLASAYDNYNQANRDYSEAETEYIKNRDNYDKVTGDYLKNKRAYNRSLAGVYDKAAPKAKEVANNIVTNAKAQYDRMKEEFRARDQQKTDNNASYPHSRDKKVGEGSVTAKKGEKVDFGGPVGNTNKSADASRLLTGGDVSKSKVSAQEMIDKAKTALKDTANRASDAVKDKSEDLSAKAKSTVQSARDSVKGMIDNARSSTAKAVNEAWDRIPKNADGTVNPFDKNFQSTYNDWKTKKDKYDSSLTGRAKDVAEKATDSVKDMIDQAKKAAKGNSASNFAREQEQTNTGSRQTKRTQEEIADMKQLEGRAKVISERNDKALEQMTAADKKYRQYLDSLGSRANDNTQLTEAEKQKKDKLYKELRGYQELYELANKDYRELVNKDAAERQLKKK